VERVADPSGITVVRGKSVRLEAFAAAGADKNVKLTDVVTAADRSPMAAGFMAWRREDSFAWTLTYDEVDLVVEGTLEIEIDGRKVRASEGDVVFIPKGSKIVFGTPHRVRVFYVTYPVAWAK
jgi:ethanolamine utilization protein EutQ